MKIEALYESHQYHNIKSLERLPLRELLDFLYLQVQTLFILASDVDFKQYAQDYSRRSYSPQYNNFTSSKTDFHNLVVAIKHSIHNNDEDSIDLEKDISLNIKIIDHFLKLIIQDKLIKPQLKMILRNLEDDLVVRSSDYRSIRTILNNWERADTRKRKLAVTRLKMALRAYGNRNELTFYLNDYIDTLNYQLNEPVKRNPEKDLELGKWAAVGLGATVFGIMSGHKKGQELRNRYREKTRKKYENR